MTKLVYLSEACDFLDSQRRPITKKDRTSGPYPYYGATGVQDYVANYIFDDELVLLAEDGGHFDDPSRGVAYRVSGKCWVNNHAHVLKPKENFNVDFLGYALKYFDVQPYITGAVIKKLNQKDARRIKICQPSLEEQKRIVDLLDQANTLLLKRRQVITLLDEYLKSVFLEMFGDPVTNTKKWQIKKLQEVTTMLGDGLHGTPTYDDNGNYFFINGNNLENGKIVIKNSTKRVSRDTFEKHKKPLNENSILVSINGTLGKVAFYRDEKIILGKSACYFNIKKEEINSIYLYFILKSDYFINYASTNSTGSTIQNVSLKTMRNLPLLLPPLNLQIQFSEIVKNVDSVKSKMLLQSEEMGKQFQALMQKSFNTN